MKLTFVLLVFTIILFQTKGCFPPLRKLKKAKSESKTDNTKVRQEVNKTVAEDTYCENCTCLQCNYTLPAPKKIINPYKGELMSLVPQKSFGSFCVKCAACLAVANQIEHLIRDLSYECETDPLKKKVLLENIVNHINTLCISGFKNFDLREYKSHHIITDDFRCTHHVESNMDGNWTKKLRELCKLYTSRVNIEDISFNVLDSVGNLTDTFCRSTGIFRDCLKINSHQNSTIDC